MTKVTIFLATALALCAAPARGQQVERTQPAQIQRIPPAQIQRAPATPVQRVPPSIVQQVRPIAPVTPPAAPKTSGTVAVAATAGWVPTGITAQKGGQMDIVARGAWSLGGSSLTAAAVAAPSFGPDGAPNTAGPGTLLPSANRGALIGRFGDGAPFLIGARFSGVAPGDGMLSISINDSPNALRDNQGTMSAVIRTAAPVATPPTRTPTPTPDPPVTKPPETTPPVTAPPTRVPPTRDPPTTKPPETREPTTPTQPPVTEPPVSKPPIVEPTPQDQTPPQDTGQTPPVVEEPLLPPPAEAPPGEPAAPPTDNAAPPVPPASAPVIPLVPLAIGGAVLAGLLLLGGLFRPRRKPGGDDSQHGGAAPRVSARVVNDGIAGQSLTITVERKR